MTAPLPWLAPFRASPVDGEVLVPGSKSLTNRALILAALGDRPSVLTRPLGSRDTTLMAEALTALGARIDKDGVVWTVTPTQLDGAHPIAIDCGLAGTVMRFVPAVAALTGSDVTFDGDPHARVRPMGTTIDTLRKLGVTIDDGGRGSLPFTVQGSGAIQGGRVVVNAAASSQFVSALLLAGARFADGVDIVHEGDPVPSLPHIDMTVTQLRLRGVEVDDSESDRWRVSPGPISGLDVEIEPDLSNAGVFIAGGLVTGGSMRIRNWPDETDQAGDTWRSITEAFGGTVKRDGADLVFTAGNELRGVDLNLHDVGELTPVVAAMAALATGPSRLRGVAHLRGHETDRLAALTAEINRLGGNATETEDGLDIRPAPLRGDVFRTYDDHRMAHAGVVLGLRVPDLYVENVVTTAKTYPNFAPVWERLMT